MNKEEQGAVDDMELGSSRIGIALLLLLLTHCCSSFHGPRPAMRWFTTYSIDANICKKSSSLFIEKNRQEAAGEDVYEIDYRGPETHSYLPPPYGPHTGPNSEVPRTRNTFGNRKEIQGKEKKFVQNGG